jgi:hypothetical protein
VWREIVNDRPADFFRPGAFELLEQYCELTIQQRKAIQELKTAFPEGYPVKLKAAKDLTAMLVSLARQLRLTILAQIDRRAVGRLTEGGDGAIDSPVDRLIGGRAVWGERPQ